MNPPPLSVSKPAMASHEDTKGATIVAPFLYALEKNSLTTDTPL